MILQGLQRAWPVVLALGLVFAFLAAARAEVVVEDEPAEVFAETASVTLDRPFWIAFKIFPKPGQYVPYVDPETGDKGLAADFGLPAGFEKGELLQSTPSALDAGAVYGYVTPFWVLQEIIPTYEAKFQEIYAFPGQVSWVECNVGECADYEKEVSLNLPFGAGGPDLKNRRVFEEARASLPAQMPWPVEFSAGGGDFSLIIYTGSGDPDFSGAVLLAARGKTGQVLSRNLEARMEEGRVIFEGRPGNYIPRSRLEALLIIPGTAPEAYAFNVANSFETEQPVSLSSPGFEGFNIWLALGFAFLGGLILNLMPCVFPVLTLKVFTLVRSGGRSPGAMRLDGLAYTLGILMTFVFLALLFLTFREAGQQIGWGFQLQSPYFVTVLGLLLFLVTLNFAGVFEMRLPFAIDPGPKRAGALGSFYTGVLATVVATPCTAPFMAPALGFALTLPTFEALAVFLGLGLGLAAPYLVVSFMPKIQKIFPKPGPWMAIFKKVLAVPLFLTVLWLVWVLFTQIGNQGIAVFALYAALITGFILGWKKRKGVPRAAKALAVSLYVVAGAASVYFTLPALDDITRPVHPEGADTVEWSDDEVWNLRLQGKGVFVNYTATWCLTCLVNERLVFTREKFQRFLAENDIVYMEADWTNNDPAIGKSLEKLGRTALPVYVFYPNGGPTREPVFLPEILTLEQAMEIISANK